MTIINPKSIAGVTSITTPSGSDNLFTVHTNNTTERIRINNDGDVIVGSGITVSPDGDIFATGVCTATSFVGSGANLTGVASTENIRTNTNATFLQNINVSGSTTTGSLVSSGAISGTTGTFTGDVDIADKIIHTGDTNTAIRFPEADTITFETAGFEQVRIDNDVQMFVEANSKQAKLQLHREDASVDADDVIGQITFTGRDSGGAGTQRVGAAISAIASNAWDTGQATGYSPSHLDFFTQSNSGVETTLTSRLRIDSDGRCIVGGGSHAGGSALVVKGGNQNNYSTVGMFSNHTNPANNTLLSQIRFGANATAVGADMRVYADADWGSSDYPSRIEFHTTPDGSSSKQVRLKIDKDGDVIVSDGDLVIGTSGHGIDFSATDNATGTSSSELFDDYEEGTWVPDARDGSLSYSNANYTKIGRMVYVSAYVHSFTDTSTNDQVTIQGLPFTIGVGGVTGGSVMYQYVSQSHACTVYIATTGLKFYGGHTSNYDGIRYNELNSSHSFYLHAWYIN